MAITTKEKIERYLLTNINSSFDEQIDAWIDAVEQYMNKETKRQLIADEEESTRRYDGVGKHDLMIDDFLTISDVSIFSSIDDDTGTSWNDYMYYYPANTTPKWRLDSTQHIPHGKQNVHVTGRYGAYDADSIPADLVQAATTLVAGIVNYSNQSEGEIKSESIGRYTVTYVTEKQSNDYTNAMATLKHYKRIR